jgi:uncharacterized protein
MHAVFLAGMTTRTQPTLPPTLPLRDESGIRRRRAWEAGSIVLLVLALAALLFPVVRRELLRRELARALQNHLGDEVKRLVRSGAPIETGDDYQGRTPLIWACTSGDVAFATDLLDRGANVNLKSADGQAPILWAAAWGRHDIVLLLLSRGADPDVRTPGGITPAMSAAACGQAQVITALRTSRADPAARDANGKTALDHAQHIGDRPEARERTRRAIREWLADKSRVRGNPPSLLWRGGASGRFRRGTRSRRAAIPDPALRGPE